MHPNYLKLSVIKAQFLRIARKCSYRIDFDFALKKLFNVLISQGYKLRVLRNLKYEVLFVCGFYFTKHISLGFYNCNEFNCSLCSHTLCSPFVFDNDFNQFRILYFINCLSTNCIFSVYCSRCGPISVLFTFKSLRDTFTELLYTIEHDTLNLFSIHFNLPNHSINNFYIQGIDICTQSNYFVKLISWIKKLKTFISPGLNSHLYIPKSYRLSLPYSISNNNLFYSIRNIVQRKYKINIHSSFSSFPNLKKLLCKSKFN